jgi:hypothetical protein
MAEEQKTNHPGREDDDERKAKEEAAEKGTGGDRGVSSDPETVGDGPSGGADTGANAPDDSEATGAGPSGGA